jgi:hypothetical protein
MSRDGAGNLYPAIPGTLYDIGIGLMDSLDAMSADSPVQYSRNLSPEALGAFGLIVGGPWAAAPKGALASGIARRGAEETLPAEVELLARHPTTSPNRIISQAAQPGGYWVNLHSGDVPTDGLMVRKAVSGSGLEKLTAEDIAQYIKNNPELRQPSTYLSVWRDSATGKIHLGVARRFDPDEIRKAAKFGERAGQTEGHDVSTGQDFAIGNWDTFVRSSEFLDRMYEMARVGREYLDQFPNKEWWNILGGPLERLYGADRLRQVAGFLATAAPRTAPWPNAQVASEYMRRLIAGEPLVQPDFRIPADAMGGSGGPGRMMPMEQTRRANLMKAGRGAIDELRLDKVRNQGQALMGDPEAMVFDRQWAKLSEDPSRGIYANSRPNIITAGNDYRTLEDAVARAAHAAGRTPRDFSADVWVGIRQTLKTKGELFGIKHSHPKSIFGESKSFSDLFDDLIVAKARHLGITPAQLEARLRSGDASLLSFLLMSPVIYKVYRQWAIDENMRQ